MLMIGLPLGAGLALAPFAGRGAIVFAFCFLLFVGAIPCRAWAFYLPDVACAMITAITLETSRGNLGLVLVFGIVLLLITVSPRAAALRRTLHFPIVDV
ncbi:MAG: hypothetical protein O2873_12075 [Proteobacteria bacterium]|nr:hypothetical protein [Pseudomonadota bacterium]